MDLMTKIATFACGTRAEIVRKRIRGDEWLLSSFTELIGGMVYMSIKSDDKTSPLLYLAGAIALDGAVRAGNLLYNSFLSKKFRPYDLNHPNIPQPGIIGTARERYNYKRAK